MSKRLLSIFIAVITAFSCINLTGCDVEEDEFPVLYFPEGATQTQITSVEPDSTSDNFHELTVALPLSEETVNLLMKLYYAKNNDLFPVEMTGADISIEYLSAINTPWGVNTITTTSTGET